MNSDLVKEQAIGRWQGIYAALGIEVGDGKHCPCPICGGKNRFRCDDKDGTGSWICNQDGAGDGWSLLMKKLGLTFPDAIEQVGNIIGAITPSAKPKESVMTPEKMREIFNGSRPVTEGDPVSRYLSSRGLTKISGKLRHHQQCWEGETKKNQHAMLAIFTGADGQAVTMHRTYLDADGKKLQIESPKKILPALKKMTGGAVQLYPPGPTLGVAEGIETAIAASEDTGLPVWAATTAVLLESFEVPPGVEHLVIFADNDKNYTGQKAAYTLANKVSVQKKISVTVYIPDVTGDDWADVYAKRRKITRG